MWGTLATLVAAYAAHSAFGLGGSSSDLFFDRWVNDGVLWASAGACLAGALRATGGRTAWILAALGLASWAIGDTIATFRFGDGSGVPLTSISDVFWLAWYPLIIAALALLVRDRVPGFELHRWIDGVVVMLLVATPWVALFLEPVSQQSSAGTLDQAVIFAYPLGDAMLVGGVVGVFALMAWRPGRLWLVLGLALAVMGLADAIYSVQALGGSYHGAAVYDPAWAAGAVLVAYAAWQPHPGRLEPRESGGFQAIVLPLTAQALAVAVQAYAYFYELPRSERVLTIIVLLISMVQIVVSRPRSRRTAAARSPDP